MALRRQGQRLVKGSAAVGARHGELREEICRFAAWEHAQELDDCRRALDLARRRQIRSGAARAEPDDALLRHRTKSRVRSEAGEPGGSSPNLCLSPR